MPQLSPSTGLTIFLFASFSLLVLIMMMNQSIDLPINFTSLPKTKSKIIYM